MSKGKPDFTKTPAFVEFVGLPGSGKTTLSHGTAVILREKNTTVIEPTYLINNEMREIRRYLTKLWYSTKLVLLRPAWALKWFFLVVQSRQKTVREFLLMIINCFFVLEIYRHHSRRNDICFLDQGICQAFLSLSYNSKTEDFIRRQLDAVWGFLSPLDFRIFHVETDFDTVIQRLKKRHKRQSRLELTADTTEFREILRSEKRKIEYLLEMLCTGRQANVVTIHRNDSANIHSAARQIADLFAYRELEK